MSQAGKSHCWAPGGKRKIRFPNEKSADAFITKLWENNREAFFPYPCSDREDGKEGCGGWHVTRMSPDQQAAHKRHHRRLHGNDV